jgi:hypothetical protein
LAYLRAARPLGEVTDSTPAGNDDVMREGSVVIRIILARPHNPRLSHASSLLVNLC